jgi:hypothetical protein
MRRLSPVEAIVFEVNEWRYIIAAYVVTWVVLIGYSIRLVAVQRRAAALLEESDRAVVSR